MQQYRFWVLVENMMEWSEEVRHGTSSAFTETMDFGKEPNFRSEAEILRYRGRWRRQGSAPSFGQNGAYQIAGKRLSMVYEEGLIVRNADDWSENTVSCAFEIESKKSSTKSVI